MGTERGSEETQGASSDGLPQADEVVQPQEIAILVVPLFPSCSVCDGALFEGDSLAEIYHVY